jgi:radical SAM superfamily enzyme YgiQ (UPF0313 family)
MTEAYQEDLFGGEAVKVEPRRDGNMAREFIVPPFTVLDTSQSYWLERKRAWLSLGIKSEVGRGLNLSIDDDHLKEQKGFTRAAPPVGATPLMFDKVQQGLNDMMGGNGFETGTSVFDPVLCELIYRWFCPPAAKILDPFAGGSVRGIVAAKLGHLYKGVDLSAKQIEENVKQAAQIVPENPPIWFWGDSANMRAEPKIRGTYDLVFSCPPYFDLEVYGDEAGELSAMTWEDFIPAYRDIIASSIFMLRRNRFACFVVGEVRDPDGYYRNFVGETVSAFEAAGARFYNEAILVTSIGTLPLRAKKYMNSNRKLGKRHQNILVFVKGDPKQAAQDCGDIDTASTMWSTAAAPAQAPEQTVVEAEFMLPDHVKPGDTVEYHMEPPAPQAPPTALLTGEMDAAIAEGEFHEPETPEPALESSAAVAAPEFEPPESMKILFVVPPYRTTDALVAQLYPMPYGPVLLGTVLQQAGHAVALKDFLVPAGQKEKIERPDSFEAAGGHNPPYQHYGTPLEDCKAWLRKHAGDFDAVGLALGQCNLYETGRELALQIKEMGLPLVVGGPYATTAPEQVMELISPDVLVQGEAEEVVVQAFEMAVRGEQGVVVGTRVDISATPLPDWSLAPPENYPEYGGRVRGVLAISRGCPWDCKFCSVHTIMSRKHRRFDKFRTEAEIMNLWDAGVRYFCFLDDNLFMTEKAVDELVEVIYHLKSVVPGFDKARFYCEEGMEVRVAAMPNIITTLTVTGFDNIAIGLETVNAARRESMKKPYNTEHMTAAIAHCKTAGITAKAFYIIGFPGDTLDSVASDLVEFGKLGLAVRPNNLKLYPGTEITNEFKAAGWIDEWYDWRLSSWHTPSSGTLQMPQVKKLKTVLGAVGKAAEDFGIAVFADPFPEIVKRLGENKYTLTRLLDGGLVLEGNVYRATPLRHLCALLLLREGAAGATTTVDGNRITARPATEPQGEVQAAIGRALHGEQPSPEPAEKALPVRVGPDATQDKLF